MVKERFNYDTEEERNRCIERYMNDYHPLGYGTTHRTWETPDGQHWVEFKRYTTSG